MLFIAVDAGYRETWGYMGIGAVAFRGGQRVAELSIARRGGSSLKAELLAIGHGLKLAEVLGDDDLCITTDCKQCIDLLNQQTDPFCSPTRKPHQPRNLVQLINHWRDAKSQCLLAWMPRDEVAEAHELATLALERYRVRWAIPGLHHTAPPGRAATEVGSTQLDLT